MKTRFMIIIGMIVAASLQSVPQTFALSCGIPLFSESYEKHDLLLHGKLIEKNLQDLFDAYKEISDFFVKNNTDIEFKLLDFEHVKINKMKNNVLHSNLILSTQTK